MAMDEGGAMMAAALDGAIDAPPSKSFTHRMFLLGAQSDAPTTIQHPLQSEDTLATLHGLQALGAQVHTSATNVQFQPTELAGPATLDCANSGTTLRLLVGTAARLDAPIRFDGDASLRQRPNASLIHALQSLGAGVDAQGDQCPLTVTGPIRPGQAVLPPNASSQSASALLLSLPFLDGDSTVAVHPTQSSKPYLALTLQALQLQGIRVEMEDDTFHVPGGQQPVGGGFDVPGDWSSAAFMLVAGAITGGRVTVRGLGPTPAPDRAILDILQQMGCRVTVHFDSVTVEGAPVQTLGTLDVSQCPDLFPILAVLAASTPGETRFTGGAALRHKESDRIHAMMLGLRACGIEVREQTDGLTVQGGILRGGTVRAHGDHRIHMAFRIANLAADGDIQVDGHDSVAVSYPEFHHQLAQLTGGVA